METLPVKRIAFLTGTRADWGKQVKLVEALRDADDFEPLVFCTGMHTLDRYGHTVIDVERSGVRTWACFNGVQYGQSHAGGEVWRQLGAHIQETHPDLIVVHGDRAETLGAAAAGATEGVLVAHIEGGESTGCIDESYRHATTMLAHHHFVANARAMERVVALGQDPTTVHIIGSPDTDVMLSDDLPSLPNVRERYGFPDGPYGLIVLHPTPPQSREELERDIEAVFGGCRDVPGISWVCIYPNADRGSDAIIRRIEADVANGWLRALPSMRFEFMLTALKHAMVLVGNSSMGVHEAPVYGTPVVNFGPRQEGRITPEWFARATSDDPRPVRHDRGDGRSAERFLAVLRTEEFWSRPVQKRLREVA